MKEEKEITQSQAITLTYLQFSMTAFGWLMYICFVSKIGKIWFPVLLAVIGFLLLFMYFKKDKKEPLSLYFTTRAIIINVITVTIMLVLIHYLNKY
jgi:heme/copper-type cytochrome/quinol oxidase subunit 4